MTIQVQTHIAHRLAHEALAAYSLPAARLRLLSHSHNTIFRVDLPDGQRAVLRMQRPGWGTLQSVRSEMMWLTALKRDADLGAPAPMPNRNRDLVTLAAVDGAPELRICMLFDWIEGRTVNAGLASVHLRRVGALTARLQAHAAAFAPPDGFVRGRVYPLTDRANRAARSGEPLVRREARDLDDEQEAVRLVADLCSAQDAARVEALLDRIFAAQCALGFGPDAYGLIHADLHQGNVRHHRRQVRPLDFDDCGWGHHLYDMAVTLSEVKGRPNTPELRVAYLAGYRSVRPLSAAHEAYLDRFIALREVQNLTWRLESQLLAGEREPMTPAVRSTLDELREVN